MTVYYRRMRYYIPYVTPAIIVLALTAIAIVMWLVLLVLGKTGTSRSGSCWTQRRPAGSWARSSGLVRRPR